MPMRYLNPHGARRPPSRLENWRNLAAAGSIQCKPALEVIPSPMPCPALHGKEAGLNPKPHPARLYRPAVTHNSLKSGHPARFFPSTRASGLRARIYRPAASSPALTPRSRQSSLRG